MSRISTLSTLLLFGLVATLGCGALSQAWIASLLGGLPALVGGLYGLLRLHLALENAERQEPRAALNLVLAAVVTAMLARMLLLLLGLGIGLKTFELSPLWIVVSFFAVHLIAQGLELKLALGARRPTAAASLSASNRE